MESFAWHAIPQLKLHQEVVYVFCIYPRLKNGQYYIGFTRDLKKRLVRHKNHSSTTTSRIEPEELVFYSAFQTKQKALDFEKYLKSSSGFAFRNKRLI